MAKASAARPLPYKVVVTKLESEHATKSEATAALKKLKAQPRALGVVIFVPEKKGT